MRKVADKQSLLSSGHVYDNCTIFEISQIKTEPENTTSILACLMFVCHRNWNEHVMLSGGYYYVELQRPLLIIFRVEKMFKFVSL